MKVSNISRVYSIFSRCLAVTGCIAIPLQPLAAQVVPDGRTNTVVTGVGGVTNVTTGTISQGHGINSFGQFDVGQGQTVNLHAPQGTSGTINFVNGSQSQINGLVQSMQNGQVGGDLYIANPQGFVVGPQGTVRGGSVSLSTPGQVGVGPDGQINGGTISGILQGNGSLAPGNVVVQGQIIANRAAQIRAGGMVTVNGRVASGANGEAGSVNIFGGAGLSLGGQAEITAQSTATARGRIEMRSDGDIRLAPGARVLSQSTGAMQAGEIVIFAEGSGFLAQGAVVSAAALGSGAGGFVEFSARNAIEAFGDLEAYSTSGPGGQILIDPVDLTLLSQNTLGADLKLAATRKITLLGGSRITSASVNGASAGDVTLIAPTIELLGGSVIDTSATGSGSGDILLLARLDDRENDTGDAANNALTLGIAQLTAVGATLRGNNVTVLATAYKDNLVDVEAATDAYGAALFGPDGALIGSDFLLKRIADAGRAVQGALTELDIQNMPGYQDARAFIDLEESWIDAEGKATIIASATTNFLISPVNQNLAFAIAASNTQAQTTLHNTAIDAGGTIEVLSVVTEEQTLVAKSGVLTENGESTAFNLAIAASLRRSRARTIVNGFRPVIAFNEGADLSGNGQYWPSYDTSDPEEYTILVSKAVGDGVRIASETVRDITLQSDAITSGEARGFALSLSVADTQTETYFGGVVAVPSGEVEITSETRTKNFLTRARVSGGSEAVANVATEEEGQGIAGARQSPILPNLVAIAANAADPTKTGEAAADANAAEGNATPGNGADTKDARFGIAMNISSQNTRTTTVLGDADYSYKTARGTETTLDRAFLVTTPNDSYAVPGGQFYADTNFVDLTKDPRVTLSARNVYQAVRSEALVRAGSLTAAPDAPGALTGDTAAQLDSSGKRATLIGITIATWSDSASVQTLNTRMRTVANVDVVAENVFARIDGRDQVGAWWTEYRADLEATEGASSLDLLGVENIETEVAPPAEGSTGDGSGNGDRNGRFGRVADGKSAAPTDAEPQADEPPAPDAPEDADTPVQTKTTDTRMFLSEVIGRGGEVGAGVNINRITLDLDADVSIAGTFIGQEDYYLPKLDPLDPAAKVYVTASNSGDLVVGQARRASRPGAKKAAGAVRCR